MRENSGIIKVNRCAHGAMSLLGGILATTSLMIAAASAAPAIYAAAEQRARLPLDNDHLLLILLLNRKEIGMKTRPPTNELGGPYEIAGYEDLGGGVNGDLGPPPPGPPNDPVFGDLNDEANLRRSSISGAGGSRLDREKRLGSLSIVNSVDVLRDRVLLELARRKAMEDQQQMGENHRVLNTVGKRVARGGSAGGGGYRAPAVRSKRFARGSWMQH